MVTLCRQARPFVTLGLGKDERRLGRVKGSVYWGFQIDKSSCRTAAGGSEVQREASTQSRTKTSRRSRETMKGMCYSK
jgi:hypothetical protein